MHTMQLRRTGSPLLRAHALAVHFHQQMLFFGKETQLLLLLCLVVSLTPFFTRSDRSTPNLPVSPSPRQASAADISLHLFSSADCITTSCPRWCRCKAISNIGVLTLEVNPMVPCVITPAASLMFSCLSVCMHVCLYVCMYDRTYVCMHVYIYIYVYVSSMIMSIQPRNTCGCSSDNII